MAPKRRASGSFADSAPAAKRGRRVQAPAGQDRVVVDGSSLQAEEWHMLAMEFLDNIFVNHSQLCDYLTAKFPSEEDRLDFARSLDDAFPGEADVEYADKFEPGPYKARLWQLSWDYQSGNHGLFLQENSRNLVSLILAQGFLTDPDAGTVEKLSVCPATLEFYKNSAFPICPKLHPSLLPCQSINFVKGQHRSLCALVSAHIILELGLLDKFKENADRFSSFCTVHCVQRTFANDFAKIDAARGGYYCVIVAADCNFVDVMAVGSLVCNSKIYYVAIN